MTLRDVTKEARVNLAAVNYHFGSKSDLMREVIRNRFAPINTERLNRLNALVAKYSPEPIPVEAIFSALFRPLFESAIQKGGPDRTLIKLTGRAITEPADFIRAIHKEFFSEVSSRFLTELKRTFPSLTDEELQYRLFFAVNTMIGTISEQVRLESISGGKLDGKNFDQLAEHLIRFVVAGFSESEAASK